MILRIEEDEFEEEGGALSGESLLNELTMTMNKTREAQVSSSTSMQHLLMLDTRMYSLLALTSAGCTIDFGFTCIHCVHCR
jgi:hypothetical protein